MTASPPPDNCTTHLSEVVSAYSNFVGAVDIRNGPNREKNLNKLADRMVAYNDAQHAMLAAMSCVAVQQESEAECRALAKQLLDNLARLEDGQ